MEVTRASSLSSAQDENLPTELDESYTVTSLTAHGTASSPIVVRKQPPATTFSLHRAPPRAFPPRPVSSNLFGPNFNSTTVSSSTNTSTSSTTSTQPDATKILSSSPDDQRRQWWEFVGYSTASRQPTGTGKPPLLPRKGILSSSKKKKPLTAPSTIQPNHPTTTTTPARSVQFGPAKAAEFENDAPPNQSLTPMPAAAAARRFPTDEPVPHPRQVQATQETKRNAAVLAEWEDSFEELLQQEEEQDGNSQGVVVHRARRQSGVWERPPRRTNQDNDEQLLDLSPESTESFEPTDEDLVDAVIRHEWEKWETVSLTDLLTSLAKVVKVELPDETAFETLLQEPSHHAPFVQGTLEFLQTQALLLAQPTLSTKAAAARTWMMKHDPEQMEYLQDMAEYEWTALVNKGLQDALERETKQLQAIDTAIADIDCVLRSLAIRSSSGFRQALHCEQTRTKQLEHELLRAQVEHGHLQSAELLASIERLPHLHATARSLLSFSILHINDKDGVIELVWDTPIQNTQLHVMTSVADGDLEWDWRSQGDGAIPYEHVAADFYRTIVSIWWELCDPDQTFMTLQERLCRCTVAMDRFAHWALDLVAFSNRFETEISMEENSLVLSSLLPRQQLLEVVYNTARLGSTTMHREAFLADNATGESRPLVLVDDESPEAPFTGSLQTAIANL